MSAFYARLEATARRLIFQFGRPGKLRRQGIPSGPPHNPQPITIAEPDCVFVETGYSFTTRSETLVQAGDKLGLISTDISGGFVPALGDALLIGAEVWSFVDIEPLAPGGITLLYEFHARR